MYKVFKVETKVGAYYFWRELDAVNFMLDIGTQRLPMSMINYDGPVYTTEEAVKAYKALI